LDVERARALLAAKRADLQTLLAETEAAGREDRSSEDEKGTDVADPAQSLTQQGMDDAIASDRLAALERAEQRLADGTYGRSVQSGKPIPDARLEADPAAELTVEEAAAREAAAQ
jgi:DnaK suppressor protein